MSMIRMHGGPEDGRRIASTMAKMPNEIVMLNEPAEVNQVLSEEEGFERPLTTVTYLQAHYDTLTDTFDFVWEGMLDRS